MKRRETRCRSLKLGMKCANTIWRFLRGSSIPLSKAPIAHTDTIRRYASTAERSSSGFTPINPNGPMPQFVNPMETLRYSNENESQYRILENRNTPNADSRGDGVLYPKSRKKRNKSVMLDLFQEGLDEIDGPAKKKKKSVMQQRSKSANLPTRLSQLVIEEEVVVLDYDGRERPLTPPISKTKAKAKPRAKSKATPKDVSPDSKEKKQSLFKAPTITKPLPVEKAKSTVVAYPSSVCNHPRLTTTENAVKNNSRAALLSKTTMSKLHSFLYVPLSLNVASTPPQPAQVIHPVSEQRLGCIHSESTMLSSKYGPCSDHDDVVLQPHDEEAVSIQADLTLEVHHRHSPDMPSAYAMLSNERNFLGEASWDDQNHDDQGLNHTQPFYQSEGIMPIENRDVVKNVAQTHSRPTVSLPVTPAQKQASHGKPFHNLPVSKSYFDEPTPSEVKELTQLLDQVERLPDGNPGLYEASMKPGEIQHEVDTHIRNGERHPVRHDVWFELYSNEPTRKDQNYELLPPFTQNTHLEVEEEESRAQYYDKESRLSDDEAMLFYDQGPASNEFEGANNEHTPFDDPVPSKVYDFEDGFDEEDMLLDQPMHSAVDRPECRPDDEDDHIPFEIEFGNGFSKETPRFDDQIPLEVEYGDDDDIEAMLFDDHTPPKEKAVFEKPTLSKFDELDEFDDGIDDSDLLEMLSTGPRMRVKVRNCVDMSWNYGSKPDANIAGRQARITSTAPRIAWSTSQSPQIIDLDTDDEFPMDESDEEEMLKLPMLIPDTYRLRLSPPCLPGDRPCGSGELYGSTLQPSPRFHRSLSRPSNQTQSSLRRPTHTPSVSSRVRGSEPRSDMLGEGEQWVHRSTDQVQTFDIQDTDIFNDFDDADSETEQHLPPPSKRRSNLRLSVRRNPNTSASASNWKSSSDYEPLQTFARPDFPDMVRDRCPVIGLSGQNFLRTCFKIGEMFKEGKRCSSFGQDAIIELFARVTFSSREAGTTKQYFVFADLWRDNPPFPEGMLINYKTTGLADTESKAFVDAGEPKMSRCLGRLKRDLQSATGWFLHIITIRETDWEEIRYTKRAVCAGEIKSELN